MPDREVADRVSPIERHLLAGVRTALLTVAVIVHLGLSFVPNGSRLSWTEADGIAFALMAVVAAGGVPHVWRRRAIPPSVRWTGVAILLLASAVVSLALPDEPVARVEHWSFGLVGWYGLFLLCDLPLAFVVAFLGTHVTLSVSGIALTGMTAAALTPMAITIVSVTGFQMGIGMTARLVRRIASAASEASRAEEAARTEEVVAETVHLDREQRYAHLLETTIPLLAGLSTGTLDPADERVRQRCAIEAARTRRLLVEGDDTVDPLVHELAAAIDVAERHGVSVALGVRGVPCPLPARVRRELLEPISEVLLMATSTARVTVLYGSGGVRVGVVADTTGAPPPGVELRHVRVTRATDASSLWTEAVWTRSQ